MPFSATGFAGIGSLVTTVPNAKEEKAFYRDVLSLDSLHDFLLDGSEIEKMIGLPATRFRNGYECLGKVNEPLGQIDIIEYQSIGGQNLYPRPNQKHSAHYWSVM